MDQVERWRTVQERPAYEVSDMGRIRSPLGLISNKRHSQGYRAVVLAFGSPYLTRTVHRLVIEAFDGPRPPGMVVAHRNGDKEDNRLNNLIYCTQASNLAMDVAKCPLLRRSNGKMRIETDRLSPKARGSRHGMSRLTEEQVVSIHRLYAEFPNASKIARGMGISKHTAADIIAGRRWRHLHPNATMRS